MGEHEPAIQATQLPSHPMVHAISLTSNTLATSHAPASPPLFTDVRLVRATLEPRRTRGLRGPLRHQRFHFHDRSWRWPRGPSVNAAHFEPPTPLRSSNARGALMRMRCYVRVAATSRSSPSP